MFYKKSAKYLCQVVFAIALVMVQNFCNRKKNFFLKVKRNQACGDFDLTTDKNPSVGNSVYTLGLSINIMLYLDLWFGNLVSIRSLHQTGDGQDNAASDAFIQDEKPSKKVSARLFSYTGKSKNLHTLILFLFYSKVIYMYFTEAKNGKTCTYKNGGKSYEINEGD